MPLTTRTFSIHMPAGCPNKKDISLLFSKNVKVIDVTKTQDEKPRYVKGSDNTNPTEVHANGQYNRWVIGVFPTEIQPCNTITFTVETDEPCDMAVEVDWTTDKGDDYLPKGVDVPSGGLHGGNSIAINC